MLQTISFNFQKALDDFNIQIQHIQTFLGQIVTKKDLNAILAQFEANQYRNKTEGTAAAGKMNMKCLLCGHSISSVHGAITESEAAKLLGTPQQSGVLRGGKDGHFVLVYGKDPMRASDKPHRKAPLPPIVPPPNKQ